MLNLDLPRHVRGCVLFFFGVHMFPSQENSVRKVAALRPGLNDEITRFSLWTGIGSARSLVKGLFECVLRADLTAESARSLEKGSEREYGYGTSGTGI